jgi:hypothetical protein
MTMTTELFVLDGEDRLDVTGEEVIRLLGAELVKWPDVETRTHVRLAQGATFDQCKRFLALPVIEIPAALLAPGDWYQWYGRWNRCTMIGAPQPGSGGLYVMHGTGMSDRIPPVNEIHAIRSASWRWLRSRAPYDDRIEDRAGVGIVIPDLADENMLAELLQLESGAGHYGPDGRAVDAWYEIVSIDELQPEIRWENNG